MHATRGWGGIGLTIRQTIVGKSAPTAYAFVLIMTRLSDTRFVLRFPLSYIWRPPFNTHIQVLDIQCHCELAIINIHTISFQFNSVEHRSKKMLPNADVCVVSADSQSVPLSNPPSSVRPVPRASSFYTSDIAGTPEKFKLIFYSPSLSARRFIWCCFFLVEI